ncbi:MAG TPA: GAF domain-containing protein, partial [Microthrixaceae bacterium]|nr:GAF domain-containing protein [Microthrixaceae bacterium]
MESILPLHVSGSAGRSQLSRLLEAVSTIGSNLEVSDMLTRIVEAAVELVNAKYGALGVLNESRTELSQFITVGIDEEGRSAIGDLPTGHGILGLLITDPRPLRLSDLSEHTDSCGFPPNHPPMKSFLGVPILIRGEAFGNLYLCDKSDGTPFTDIDEELVVAMAAAAGVAIENTRLYKRVAEGTLMADRDRIARDLHDTVIQRLFGIGLSLEGVIKHVRQPVVAERIVAAVDDLDATIKEIRSVIFELHSARQIGMSVRQASIELAAESARSLGFEPTVHFDGPIDTAVTGEIVIDLLAVQREALANAARHAQAQTIDLRISAIGGDLVLEVADDGVGPPEHADEGGRGVHNMRS